MTIPQNRVIMRYKCLCVKERPYMRRTKSFLSVAAAALCLIPAMLCPLVLASCPGNGGAMDSDDDTYTLGGSGGGLL